MVISYLAPLHLAQIINAVPLILHNFCGKTDDWKVLRENQAPRSIATLVISGQTFQATVLLLLTVWMLTFCWVQDSSKKAVKKVEFYLFSRSPHTNYSKQNKNELVLKKKKSSDRRKHLECIESKVPTNNSNLCQKQDEYSWRSDNLPCCAADYRRCQLRLMLIADALNWFHEHEYGWKKKTIQIS